MPRGMAKKKSLTHTIIGTKSESSALSFEGRNVNEFEYIYIYIIYSLAALGLHCCARAFSSCREQALFSSCGCIA